MAMEFGHGYGLYPTPLQEYFSWAKIRARFGFGDEEGQDGGINRKKWAGLTGSENPMVDPPYDSMKEFVL